MLLFVSSSFYLHKTGWQTDTERQRPFILRTRNRAHSVKHEAISFTHWLPSRSPEMKPSLKPLREPTTSIAIKQTLIWEFNWFYFPRHHLSSYGATLGSRALVTWSQQKAHNVFYFFFLSSLHWKQFDTNACSLNWVQFHSPAL